MVSKSKEDIKKYATIEREGRQSNDCFNHLKKNTNLTKENNETVVSINIDRVKWVLSIIYAMK